MESIKALDNLGNTLFGITQNSIVFKETNKYLTSTGFYYEVSVTYCEDEVETTFSIDENNDVFDVSTQYTGSLKVAYLSNVDFNRYEQLNREFEQLATDSNLTFEDVEKLSYMYDYTY